MINYTIGNILESSSDAIINTVNCEGYMGKGIAYQFKVKYPNNNKQYEEACKTGKFKIGSILTFVENEKLIINFPTKSEWRKKSEYSYITKGLETLVDMLPKLNVRSIAFPPLGCGNGGLEWTKVKTLITDAIEPYEDYFDFILYEPSNNINTVTNTKKIPKLNASHVILMHLKLGLKKFNKTRLQKSAFFINIFSGEQYFKFNAHNFGPYTHAIDILSRDIKEYQQYYNFTTEQALQAAENTLVSNSLIEKLEKFEEPILKSLYLTNQIDSDKELELISTILYILTVNKAVKLDSFPNEFLKWSEEKASKFTSSDINLAIDLLKRKGILIETLVGIELSRG